MGRTIGIISDFGNTDNYVGIMKGVIRNISPFADIIDINNNIENCNIISGAYSLESSYRYFPNNTIFLCIVDPGVGSSRRAIAIETESHYFVAPDNGLLTAIIKNEKIKRAANLSNSSYHLINKSATFHGRDIFAPVAAHISMRIELDELGERVDVNSLILLPDYVALKDDYSIEGSVVHKDKFGNIISNIPTDWIDKKKRSKDLSCRI